MLSTSTWTRLLPHEQYSFYYIVPLRPWKINACRLYLNLLLLFDITTIKDNTLKHGIFLGDKTNLRTSNFLWPLQQSPNNQSWKLWYLTINHLYCINTKSVILRKENDLDFGKQLTLIIPNIIFLSIVLPRKNHIIERTSLSINGSLPPFFPKQLPLSLIPILSTHTFQKIFS